MAEKKPPERDPANPLRSYAVSLSGNCGRPMPKVTAPIRFLH